MLESNATSVPVWIFRMLFVSRDLMVQIWAHFWGRYSSEKSRQRIPIDVSNSFFRSVVPWVHCSDWCWGWRRLCMSLDFHNALLAIDILAGIVTLNFVMYLTVVFSFCDLDWGLDLLKCKKQSYVLGFGHSLRPLMPTNSAWSLTQNNLLLLFVCKPSCVSLQAVPSTTLVSLWLVQN